MGNIFLQAKYSECENGAGGHVSHILVYAHSQLLPCLCMAETTSVFLVFETEPQAVGIIAHPFSLHMLIN